jgi:hypothetical protein
MSWRPERRPDDRREGQKGSVMQHVHPGTGTLYCHVCSEALAAPSPEGDAVTCARCLTRYELGAGRATYFLSTYVEARLHPIDVTLAELRERNHARHR